MTEWQPIETAPKDARSVLIHYLTPLGKSRIIKAMYAPKHGVEANLEYDELDHEYDEDRDCFFIPEGWYEQIDNWDDFSSIKIDDRNTPTHWMPLPPAPEVST